jgi:PAS domain S-box-containing protein
MSWPEPAFLAAVVDAAASLIAVFDRDRRLVLFNRACEEATGFSQAEVAEHGIWATVIPPDEADAYRAAAAAARAGGGPVRHENGYLRKDGTRLRIAWTTIGIRDAAGAVTYLVTTGVEVTEQRLAEAALRESEERFRTMADSAPALIWTCDADGVVTFINEAWATLTGLPREAIVADGGWSLYHPDDLAAGRAAYDRALAVHEGYEHRYRVRRVDGAYLALLDRVVPRFLPDGSFAGLLGIAADVTELDEAAAAVRRSEELFRALADSAPAIIWMADERGAKTFYNRAWLDFTGRSLEESIGRGWERDTHPEDLPWVVEAYDAAVRSRAGYELEYRLRRRDGAWVWVYERANPRFDARGAFAGLTGTTIDIAARKEAEDALLRRDAIMQAVALGAERALREPSVEQAIEELLGGLGAAADVSRAYVFEHHERDGLRTHSLRHEWCAPGIEPSTETTVLGDIPYFDAWDERLPAGEVVNANVRDLSPAGRAVLEPQGVRSILVVPVFTGQTWWGFLGVDECRAEREWSATEIGALRAAAGIVGAALERAHAEQALRESEERFSQLSENVADAFWLDVPGGPVLYVNRAFETIWGRDREEFYADPGLIRRTIHPEDRPAVYAAYDRAREEEYDLQYRIVRPDGDVRWIRDRCFHVASEDGVVTRVADVIMDITDRKRENEERRRLEEQMREAQKLESLGVLAGGIAHDFNNLLMGVLGNAGLALAELPPGSPVRQTVEQIERAALRAAELTNQMLAYAGKGRLVVEPVDVTHLVEEMAHLLSAAISKKAVLAYDLDRNLPAVEGDATQLRQIVMNLITNASDALGDAAGVIRIRTALADASEQAAALERGAGPAAGGEFVVVEVSDTGCGMDADTRERIFDPFFTTKFTGRGLGLAGVLGTVRGHRGAVMVESEPGRGTRVRVLLPAAAVTAPAARAPEPVPDGSALAGTILVVDDEEAVRAVARAVLERAGFTVLTAADGPEGIDAFRANPDGIDLVLLDMTMPSLSGAEVLGALRAVREDVRVVLSSGYSDDETRSRLPGLAGFIQKPYRPAELMAAVRDALTAA